MSRRYPGLGGMMREMFRDDPEQYKRPEDIDAETDAEQKENEEDPDEVTDVIPVGSEREAAELRNAKETLWDLRFGIVALSLFCLLFCFFASPPWRYAVGIVIGCALALLLVTGIYKSVETAVMLDPAGAMRYARKRTFARYILTFAVMAAGMFFGGPAMGAGIILATFTVKPSAYFQPWFRKLKRLLFKGGE